MFSKKDLYKLILPLIVEQLLAVTIGMADTIMVAGLGEAAVSSVSLVDTINMLIINVFTALATGGAVVSAQYLGSRDSYNACIAAKQLVLVTAGLSSVIMAVGVAFNAHILHIIFGNVEPLVMQNAEIYFLISALSYPFIALYNAGAAIFRSMGNSKISMFTSILMNTINISGNALLIFVFKWGVAGAAAASLASRVTGAIIILVLLRNRGNSIHIMKYFCLDLKPQMVKSILRIGIPNGLENGMFQFGKILVQGIVASFGTVAIAAHAVAGNIAVFPQIPGVAIGLAMVTVVGQCVGAGNYDEARMYMKKLLAFTYLSMGILNLLFLLGVRPIVGFYGLSAETTQTAVRLLSYNNICCTLLWPLSFAFPNGLRAANDVKFTMTVAIFSMWVFRIGFAFLFAHFTSLGIMGVWIAMTIDWLVRCIFFGSRFISGKWMNKRLV